MTTIKKIMGFVAGNQEAEMFSRKTLLKCCTKWFQWNQKRRFCSSRSVQFSF